MMEDKIYLNYLFDYYGKLLTDKQRLYYIDYYFNDLSLSEISINYNVTRNAVFKSLKEIENKLNYYQSILHLYQNKNNIEKLVSKDILNKIKNYI